MCDEKPIVGHWRVDDVPACLGSTIDKLRNADKNYLSCACTQLEFDRVKQRIQPVAPGATITWHPESCPRESYWEQKRMESSAAVFNEWIGGVMGLHVSTETGFDGFFPVLDFESAVTDMALIRYPDGTWHLVRDTTLIPDSKVPQPK